MNKRQKKKLYKKRTGHNPPKWLKNSHDTYHMGMQEGKTFSKALKEWAQPFRKRLRESVKYLTNTYNTVNTARILSRHRRK